MGTAANVVVGATGKVYGAVTGTTLPTAEIQGLAGAFTDVGYISDAGVIQHIGTNVTVITAWGGDVIRKVRSEHDLTYKFVMLETTATTLTSYYGTQSAAATVTQIKAQAGLRQAWVVDVVDGSNLIRIAIPDGEVIELDDVTYATTDAVAYGISISCYADSSGVKAYKYVHDSGAS